MRVPAIKSWLLLATAAFIGYVAGINVGYTQGFDSAVNHASGDAAAIASVLEAIESGEASRAVEFLEAHLDALLINNSIGRESSPLILIRWIVPQPQRSIDSLAADGATYRLENPHRQQNDEVRSAVDDAVWTILERQN